MQNTLEVYPLLSTMNRNLIQENLNLYGVIIKVLLFRRRLLFLIP